MFSCTTRFRYAVIPSPPSGVLKSMLIILRLSPLKILLPIPQQNLPEIAPSAVHPKIKSCWAPKTSEITFTVNNCKLSIANINLSIVLRNPGYRSRYTEWLRAGRPRGRSSNPGRGKNFLFSMSYRPVLGPTGYRGYRGQGVKRITHLQIVPRSKESASIHPLPHTSSWRTA
jgi:hypothetical protein